MTENNLLVILCKFVYLLLSCFTFIAVIVVAIIFLSFKGLRQYGRISIDETIQSRAGLVF